MLFDFRDMISRVTRLSGVSRVTDVIDVAQKLPVQPVPRYFPFTVDACGPLTFLIKFRKLLVLPV